MVLNKPVVIGLVAAISLVVLAGAGIGGYLLFTQMRGQGALERAEEAYADGRWGEAKANFTWYLVRHPEDYDIIPKYIESCLNLTRNRETQIKDAARAYLRRALAQQDDIAIVEEAIAFHVDNRLWPQLDYAVEALSRSNPDLESLAVARAIADENLGRLTQAVSGYEALIAAGTATPACYSNLALLLREQGLEEQARQVMPDAVAANPDRPELKAEHARYLLEVGEIDEAAAAIQAALEAGADSARAHMTAARIASRRSAWEAVATHAEKAVAGLPAEWEAHLLYARSYLARDRSEEAIAYLRGLEPQVLANSPELMMVLAEEQIELGDVDGVEETVELFREAHPDRTPVFEYFEARLLIDAGRVAEAVEMLERVVEQAPSLQVARYFLAGSYIETGKTELARSTLDLYLRNNPDDQRARILFEANFAERTGVEDLRAAQALLEIADPPPGRLLATARMIGLGIRDAEEDAQAFDMAKRLLERAITALPTVPQGYAELGALLIAHGKPDDVRGLLQRAIERGIEAPALKRVEGALAIKEGQPERAKELYQAAMDAEGFDGGEATQWAEAMAEQDAMPLAHEFLQMAREALSDGDQIEVDFARADLHMRAGEYTEAKGVLDTRATDSALVTRVNDQRLVLARMVSADNEADGISSAEAILDDVDRSEPGRPDSKVLRARLHMGASPPNLDAASQLAEAAREASPTNAESLLLSSEVARRLGRADDALAFATEAYNLAPRNPRIAESLARMQIQAGDFADAIVVLTSMRERFPNVPVFIELLTEAYTGARRHEEADSLLEALEERSGEVDPVLRGRMLLGRGQFEDAVTMLEAAFEADPENIDIVQPLVVALVRLEETERAEKFLSGLAKERATEPQLWNELGDFYLAMEDNELLPKASSAFFRAMALKKEDSQALRGLIEVQLRSGNRGAAIGLCDRYLKHHPGDVQVLSRKASLLMGVPGRAKEALATIELALARLEQPMFYFMRGYLRLGIGEYAEAIEDLQRFNQSGGSAPGSLDTLMAEAYLGLGNLELARAYYESAKSGGVKSSADESRLARIAAGLQEAEKS